MHIIHLLNRFIMPQAYIIQAKYRFNNPHLQNQSRPTKKKKKNLILTKRRLIQQQITKAENRGD